MWRVQAKWSPFPLRQYPEPVADSPWRRVAGALPPVGGGLVLVTAFWFMLDLTPDNAIPVVGQQTDHARVVASLGTDANGLPLFAVELTETGLTLRVGMRPGHRRIRPLSGYTLDVGFLNEPAFSC